MNPGKPEKVGRNKPLNDGKLCTMSNSCTALTTLIKLGSDPALALTQRGGCMLFHRINNLTYPALFSDVQFYVVLAYRSILEGIFVKGAASN